LTYVVKVTVQSNIQVFSYRSLFIKKLLTKEFPGIICNMRLYEFLSNVDLTSRSISHHPWVSAKRGLLLYGSTWVYNFPCEARFTPHHFWVSAKRDLLLAFALHGKLQTHVELYNNRPCFALTQRCGVDLALHRKLK